MWREQHGQRCRGVSTWAIWGKAWESEMGLAKGMAKLGLSLAAKDLEC